MRPLLPAKILSISAPYHDYITISRVLSENKKKSEPGFMGLGDWQDFGFPG
jgi:hypothetical protein